MGHSLGIDLGGTWLRACLVDGEKKILKRIRVPAVSKGNLPEQLANLKRVLRFPRLQKLTIGSTGIWEEAAKRRAAKSLRPFAGKVQVISDLELAQVSAFAGGPGLIVVAGTGSAAYGRAAGQSARAGGWGPLLGDDGSAFWIGREVLRDPELRKLLGEKDPLRLARKPHPVRSVAHLAGRLLKLAKKNSKARALRLKAASALAATALEAAEKLPFPGKIPVSWRGGLFKDRYFLKDFLRALKRRSARFDPRPPLLDPEAAAAILY